MVCPAWSRTPVLNQKLAAYRASERAIVEDQYQAADMLYFQGVFKLDQTWSKAPSLQKWYPPQN